MKSRTISILVAYAATFCSLLSSIFLKPYYIGTLGMDAYGLYIYVLSLAQYATIMDMGIATVMVRYRTEYQARGDAKGGANFSAHCLLLVVLVSLIIAVLGVWIVKNPASIVFNRSREELEIAAVLFKWMFVNIIVVIWQHYFDGGLLSEENYVPVKTIALLRIILKIACIYAFIENGYGIVGIVVGDLVSNCLCLLTSIVYIFRKTNFSVKLHAFDKSIFQKTGILMLTLMMQSVVLYLNNAIDKVLIGALLSNAAVATYEIAVTFNSLYNEIPTITNSVYQRQIVQMVADGADNDALANVVIRVGRYQLIVCGAILSGFILFGRHFISLWVGNAVNQAYYIALLLMIPCLIPLVENLCLSILTAKDKRLFRSLVLLGIAILNLLLSVLLIKLFGTIGAAIGTCVSLLLGNCIVMNVYYRRVLGLPVIRILKSISYKILPCLVVTAAVLIPLAHIAQRGYAWLFLQIIVYCSLLAILLMRFGLNSDEKSLVEEKWKKMTSWKR